jgi:succinoglycan biosynthesis protein ExoV
MKLTFFRGKAPNFGDELNPWMWPRLLPENFLDEDESELFVGIGSILLDTIPAAPLKHVMGSGYAGYTAPPPIHDGSWNVVFVRGPRTAAELGLPPEKAISDSAILLRALDMPAPAEDIGVAFMPHYESLDRGFWAEACRLAGVTLIDPRHDVEPVIAAIRGAKLLITEAMHGAIVADAMRTPWIPVLPIHSRHHGKWLDWSDSLSIELRPHRIRPTSLMEFYVGISGGRGKIEGRAGRVSRSRLAAPANKVLTYLAAERLRKLAGREPQLSRDAVIEHATIRAMEALDRFVRSRHLAYRAAGA